MGIVIQKRTKNARTTLRSGAGIKMEGIKSKVLFAFILFHVQEQHQMISNAIDKFTATLDLDKCDPLWIKYSAGSRKGSIRPIKPTKWASYPISFFAFCVNQGKEKKYCLNNVDECRLEAWEELNGPQYQTLLS
eukprot:TRINITY_DN3618_c0_g1_i4.p1 TRINITY_DN3618_c0_g1~~TRINITY_DN3618_c0_g1_i4.p1  ORF type:complete len:134 (-),score=19.62 TRINITY_DN3618_c0_g1_i4:232-633(-)